MTYIVKSGKAKDTVVYFPNQRKKIILENATQQELKLLFDMKHPFIEEKKNRVFLVIQKRRKGGGMSPFFSNMKEIIIQK